MQNRLYLAEKPNVGRKLANFLGIIQDRKTYVETQQGIVTWAIGHVLDNAPPESYNPVWKDRSISHLPILPRDIKMVPTEDKGHQLKVVVDLIKRLGTGGEVVISTDAGEEGELIGREILVYCGYKGKVSRLWANDQTPAALTKALANLRPGRDFESLYEAAWARACGDWIVGMNMSRAFGAIIKLQKGCSVGRVITPTLAMIVRRDLEIENFRPRDYFEVNADVLTEVGGHQLTLRHAPPEKDRMWDCTDAERIAEQAKGKSAPLKVEQETVREAPRNPPSLSMISQIANRRFGWTAKQTLDILQSLYEKHAAISYPRTDYSAIPEEKWVEVPGILANLQAANILPGWPESNWQPMQRKKVWDASKCGDHYAIIPTTNKPPIQAMTEDERTCFQLVAQMFVACLLPDAESLKTTVAVQVGEVTFSVTGSVPQKPGWRVVLGDTAAKPDDQEGTLPPVVNGMVATVQAVKVVGKKTTAPSRYDEALLLDDMENPGKFARDPKMRAQLNSEVIVGSEAKRVTGIGTPATRAGVIERIKARYVEEVKGKGKGKKLVSNADGRALIALVEKRLPQFAYPDLTARWEIFRDAIITGAETYRGFMAMVELDVREGIQTLRGDVSAEDLAKGQPVADGTVCPKSGEPVIDMGKMWRFPGYLDAKCFKEVRGRTMLLSEYVQAFERSPEHGDYLDGFIYKDQGGQERPTRRALRYAPNPALGRSFELVDEEGRSISDKMIVVEGIPCFKEFHGRQMSEEDWGKVLKAGKDGFAFEGFVSATKGTKYNAIVWYNKKAEPRPKFELRFEDRDGRSTGSQKAGAAQTSAPRKTAATARR